MNRLHHNQQTADQRSTSTPWQKLRSEALAGSFVASNTRPAPNPPQSAASATGYEHREYTGAEDVHLRGCRGSLAAPGGVLWSASSLHSIAPQSIATSTVYPLLTVHYGIPDVAVRPERMAKSEPAHGLSLSTWLFQLSPAGPLPCQAAGAAPSLRCGPAGDTAAHRAALGPATGAPWRCRGPPERPCPGIEPAHSWWANL